MTQLINPEVLEYADAHTTAPPAHLESVDASTKEDFTAWGMISWNGIARVASWFVDRSQFGAPFGFRRRSPPKLVDH